MTKPIAQKSLKKAAPRRFAVGETLLEVILALFVVALGAGTATSLIVSSLQANTFSRNNLVAMNLAVEGLEAMQNILDTNRLKFGFDKSNCWNLTPQSATGDCKIPYPQIEEGYYTIDLNPSNYSWGLTSIAAGLDLSNNALATNDDYKLGYVGINNINGKDVFVTNALIPIIVNPTITGSGESNFYRMIQIDYPTNNPANDEYMDVISTVQWDQNGVHTVRLPTTLANYEKVPL